MVSIDIMVGMAMLFVVIGHLSVGSEPEWYSRGLHAWIYSFHMELFVFLSAFLIRYTYKGVNSLLEYSKYIWRKFRKFFLWFIIIGIAVSLLKSANLLSELSTLLLYPRQSETAFLWYIYLLFGYYLLSPLYFRLPEYVRIICCAAALFLPLLNAGPILCASDFCQYTFFYCLGVLCAEWKTKNQTNTAASFAFKSSAFAALPFLLYTLWLLFFGYSNGFEFRQLGWWTIATGLFSLPFFYFIAVLSGKVAFLRKTFEAISRNCYLIYLLQMFVIWGIHRLLPSLPFIPFAFVATISALTIPILIGTALNALREHAAQKKQDNRQSRPAKNTSLK